MTKEGSSTVSRLCLGAFELYLRQFPVRRGKLFLTRHLIPHGKRFVYEYGDDCRLLLSYHERVGFSALTKNGFEKAEIDFMRKSVVPGDLVIDIGAHAGVYTVALAKSVGPHGNLIACEPLPSNVRRLKENVRLNRLDNVLIWPLALAAYDGELDLYLANDPAYASTVCVKSNRSTSKVLKVRSARLDTMWTAMGKPKVRGMKIDVEGSELAVLSGGEKLLKTCKPLVLIELDSSKQFEKVGSWLRELGYSWEQPRDFAGWNYVFR